MKEIILLTVLTLLLACFAHAQTGQEACPKIRLSLPERFLFPERSTTFSVKLEGDKDYSKLEYFWIISGGTINQGQGTSKIEFTPKEEDKAQEIGVAVKIRGIPGQCADTVSDIVQVANLPIGDPVDSFGKLPLNNLYPRLDGFLNEVATNSDDQGLVELQFAQGDSRTYKVTRLKNIIRHLKFRKFDLTRLIFAISEGDEERTELWVVPPGAKLPEMRRPPYKRISEENSQIIKADELLQRIPELCLRNGSTAARKKGS